MQEKARKVFVEMIRDCGTDIVRMQASFEMYLGQYMADFPEERQLLLDAFKVGIPHKILQHAGEPDYPKYLAKLAPRFAEAAKRMEDECAWGVDTWAVALRRTGDYVAPVVADRTYVADEAEAENTPEKQTVTNVAMAVIVTAGGGIGAAMAALLFPLALAGAGLSAAFMTGGSSTGSHGLRTENDQLIFFVIIGLVAATVGGVAALGGWMFGKGAENPWASFSVACGTAFTMFFVISFMPFIPFIIKPVVFFCSVFGTTYKSAARGGNY